MMRALLPVGALLLALPIVAVRAATPSIPSPAADACQGIGPKPEPLPPSLVGAFLRAFGLRAPELAQGAVARCAGGKLLACTPGANLPCGHADTRQDLPPADARCAQHQDAGFIPAYVTGHATIYAWRCAGPRAVIAGQVAHTDAQGCVAEYWRPLSP